MSVQSANRPQMVSQSTLSDFTCQLRYPIALHFLLPFPELLPCATDTHVWSNPVAIFLCSTVRGHGIKKTCFRAVSTDWIQLGRKTYVPNLQAWHDKRIAPCSPSRFLCRDSLPRTFPRAALHAGLWHPTKKPQGCVTGCELTICNASARLRDFWWMKTNGVWASIFLSTVAHLHIASQGETESTKISTSAGRTYGMTSQGLTRSPLNPTTKSNAFLPDTISASRK